MASYKKNAKIIFTFYLFWYTRIYFEYDKPINYFMRKKSSYNIFCIFFNAIKIIIKKVKILR